MGIAAEIGQHLLGAYERALGVDHPFNRAQAIETVGEVAGFGQGSSHAARQPLPSVHADLDAERQPGLDAGTHEAEPWMDLIVVKVQALAIPRLCLNAFVGAVAHDLERPARLYRGQHADQPCVDLVGRGNLACYVLFGAGRRGQVLHWPSALPSQRQRAVLQLLGQLQGGRGEFRQPHLHRPQIRH